MFAVDFAIFLQAFGPNLVKIPKYISKLEIIIIIISGKDFINIFGGNHIFNQISACI